ncbi:hypothetical protein WJX72_002329 [[Myrmecia] bisecta]|uniref:Uncharacterized protein n=1 Tax=[Myrmecia] bisecta TaxID=41462 RepID=A0AAW1PVC6_9CHLO
MGAVLRTAGVQCDFLQRSWAERMSSHPPSNPSDFVEGDYCYYCGKQDEDDIDGDVELCVCRKQYSVCRRELYQISGWLQMCGLTVRDIVEHTPRTQLKEVWRSIIAMQKGMRVPRSRTDIFDVVIATRRLVAAKVASQIPKLATPWDIAASPLPTEVEDASAQAQELQKQELERLSQLLRSERAARAEAEQTIKTLQTVQQRGAGASGMHDNKRERLESETAEEDVDEENSDEDEADDGAVPAKEDDVNLQQVQMELKAAKDELRDCKEKLQQVLLHAVELVKLAKAEAPAGGGSAAHAPPLTTDVPETKGHRAIKPHAELANAFGAIVDAIAKLANPDFTQAIKCQAVVDALDAVQEKKSSVASVAQTVCRSKETGWLTSKRGKDRGYMLSSDAVAHFRQHPPKA